MLSALGYIVARVGDQIYGAGRTEHDAIKLAAARLQASEEGVRALLVDGRVAAEEAGPAPSISRRAPMRSSEWF